MKIVSLIFLGALALGAMSARSAEGEEPLRQLSLRASIASTDNLFRNEEEVDATYGVLGFDTRVEHESRRLKLSLDGVMDYHRYDRSDIDDEPVGFVRADGAVSLIEDVLSWRASDEFGQVRKDSRAALGPSNREDLNVFSTGPVLDLRLGSRSRIGASAQFSDRRYGDTQRLDSSIYSGELGAYRTVSTRSSVGVVGEYRKADYDEANVDARKVSSALMRYSRDVLRGELGIDGGWTWLDQDGSNDSGPLIRANFSKEISARSRLRVRGGREYRDAGDVYRDRLVQRDYLDESGDYALSADTMTRSFVAVDYTLRQDRTSYGFGVELADDDYEIDDGFDRQAMIYRLTVGRVISDIMRASLFATYRDEDREADSDQNREWRAGIALTTRLSRRFSLAMQYDHGDRDQGNSGVSFTENRVQVGLVFEPNRRD